MQKLYIMKWSNRPGTYNYADNHGKWMGIDSGCGYPYACDSFISAQLFRSLEDAKQYQKSFPELDIFELTIETNLVK